MPDHAPPAPEGCVYGPWWDGLLGTWLCIVDDYPGYWDVRYLHWDFEDVLESPMSRELLRLAKENAELRAENERLLEEVAPLRAPTAITSESPTVVSLGKRKTEE